MFKTTEVKSTRSVPASGWSLAKWLQALPFKRRHDVRFKSAGVLTLGVEIELQLVDPATGLLLSMAEPLLKALRGEKKIKREYYQSAVELVTGKCYDVNQAESDLRATMDGMIPVAKQLGIAFSGTGAHPVALTSECLVSPGGRYQELSDRNQWLARQRTVYGLHVHLGMANGDECVRFNNFFMHFLPHLLALSASSPYWQAEDTGLASCRPVAYEAMPTSGLPYHVRNWREFEHLCATLKACGSISSLKDLWWDLRPSPDFGTLEIRVCDGAATLAEAMAITAFIHLLANWFADHASWIESVSYPPRWLSRENKWRAIRHGLNAQLVLSTEGKTRSLRDDIGAWMDKLTPYVGRLGYETHVETLQLILKQGNSSERQRQAHARRDSFEDLLRFNMREFAARSPLWSDPGCPAAEKTVLPVSITKAEHRFYPVP